MAKLILVFKATLLAVVISVAGVAVFMLPFVGGLHGHLRLLKFFKEICFGKTKENLDALRVNVIERKLDEQPLDNKI